MSGDVVIRCSALSDYPDCNRRGAARLFGEVIRAMGHKLRYLPRSAAAAVGTAVHKGVATALEEKARTGSLPPISVPVDVGRDVIAELAREGLQFDAQGGPTRNLNDATKQVASMAGIYHTMVAPDVQPVIIEQRLNAQIEPGLVLSGAPDVVAVEPHAIRDLKTGVRPPGNPAPQIGGYSLLARTHGMKTERAIIDYVKRVAVTQPQPDPVAIARNIAAAESAASNIMRTIARDMRVFLHGDAERRISPGDPWAFQANPSSILCSAKWCPAHGTSFCHEGR